VVTPVKNEGSASYLKKPQFNTGLWTSTYRESTQDSAWVSWCKKEDFGNPYGLRWYLLEPKHTARIYCIRGEAEAALLLKDYSWIDERVKSLYDVFSEFASYTFTGFDFERLAQDYDGLQLTARGNVLLHNSLRCNMNAWDAESTLWFRWCFTRVEEITPALQKESVL